jgi:hypothetical protein
LPLPSDAISLLHLGLIRVVRWFIFKPQIPIWVNFGDSCHVRVWYILWPFGKFSGHLIYFMAPWYIVPEKSGNRENVQKYLRQLLRKKSI